MAAAGPTHQFDQFLGWDGYVQNITATACKSELADYKTGNSSNVNRPNGGKSALVTPVIDCILENFTETRKTELAASAVILGLLPAILQSLGSTAAETGVLSLRRPFLAFLIAVGSTTVAGAKGAEFTNILSKFVELQEHAHPDSMQLRFNHIPRFLRPLLSLLEFLAVLGAIGNMVHLSYVLSVHAIVVFAREAIFLVPLWVFIATVLHTSGMVAVLVRVRLAKPPQSARSNPWFVGWLREQFICCAFQTPRKLEWNAESLLYHALTYAIDLGTVAHVVLGTLIMSSLIFFSVVDSVHILGRYAASVLVCRAVLRFELVGMAEAMAFGFNFNKHEWVELAYQKTKTVGGDQANLLGQPSRP